MKRSPLTFRPGTSDDSNSVFTIFERSLADLVHQAIAEAYGGSITNLTTVYHGVTGQMKQLVSNEYLFKGIPVEFDAGRYHSWVVEPETLPADLEITVENDEGYIMALRHREHDVRGVQFHPESVLTEYGGKMIMNWLTQS